MRTMGWCALLGNRDSPSNKTAVFLTSVHFVRPFIEIIWIFVSGCCWLCHPGFGEVQHWEGHCRLHQEGIWQEVQPNVALYRWQKLWLLRHTWNSTFHLLLPGTGRHSTVQKWLNSKQPIDALIFYHDRVVGALGPLVLICSSWGSSCRIRPGVCQSAQN